MRHHLPLVAASVIFALGVAWFYVANLTPSYNSSAVVLLSPAPGNPLTAETASSSGVQLTVAMETEEQLVATTAVRSTVSEFLGREAPDEGERLHVAVRPNTQMLEIGFTSDAPEKARAGAQAFADGYLGYRAEQARLTQEGRVESLQLQVDETDASLRRAVAQAAQADTSSYASQEVQLYAARLAQLTTSLSTAQSVSTDPGSVINPAEAPTSANELPAWLLFVAAGGVGIVGGVMVAVLREWRRDLVRSGEPVDLGLPVFTTVASSQSGGLATSEGGSPHEAYRRLRAAVIANAPRPHVLAVAPVANESTTVGADLAVVLAQAKLAVLLIAVDPDGPSACRALGLGERPGVAEVVSRGADAESLMARTHGISVLPPGLDNISVRDLAASPAFHRLVDQMRRRFDYVLLDGFPAAGDEMLLVADSALIVLTQDRTTRAQVTAALERFEQLGVRPLGAVRERRGRRGRRAHQATPALAAVPDVDEDVVVDQVESRAHA